MAPGKHGVFAVAFLDGQRLKQTQHGNAGLKVSKAPGVPRSVRLASLSAAVP